MCVRAFNSICNRFAHVRGEILVVGYFSVPGIYSVEYYVCIGIPGYSGEVEGVLMAAAALIRMKLEDRITEYLPVGTFVPAVGQGALGIEVHDGDELIQEIIAPLNHKQSWLAVTAERAFLKALGGGCREPIAALGVIKGSSMELRGMVANSATHEAMYADVRGSASAAEQLGVKLARGMMRMGADALIGRHDA